MHDHRQLQVWRAALDLARETYLLATSLPKHETYGLASQLRRSAVSVPSNIAEGCGRRTPADFLRFLDVALGSACELETQLQLANDFGYVEAASPALDKVGKVRAMLVSLIRHVEST